MSDLPQPIGARVATTLRRAGLDLLYLALGLATSILGFVVWVTGVTASLSLIVLVIGLPVAFLAFLAFRWTAELDRRNAALVRGRALTGEYRDGRGQGFLARFGTVFTDAQTWRDLLWLVAHSCLGFFFGVLALTSVATVLVLATLPFWYFTVSGGPEVIFWTADTLPEALAGTLLAIPAALVTVALLRGMALAESALATVLLGGGDERAALI